jgi:hypothetical protein
MRPVLAAVLLFGALASPAFGREPHRPVAEARARVEHHLGQVNQLADHFERLLLSECPRFATPQEWRAYLDGEVDRVVLLMAHLEQAWIEAKHTGDDEVRRTAKAPRKRVDQARALLDKLSGCAEGNGAPLSQLGMRRRIEREVPVRQAQIALPSSLDAATVPAEASPAVAPAE